MKTKTWKAAAFGALSLASVAPAAHAAKDEGKGPFTAGVALTSDSRFRGISDSDRGGAVQGWVTYQHDSGLYAHAWASTIDYDDRLSHDSSAEIALVLGYTHRVAEDLSAWVKGVYYWYPDADTPPGNPNYDYFEIVLGAGHDFGAFSVLGEVEWSPDYFYETGDAFGTSGRLTVPLLDSFLFFDRGLKASGNVGYQWIDDNFTYGAPDYLFYDVGVTASWGIFSFDVRWADTDIERARCFGGLDLCEGGVVVSLSASLSG